MCRVKSPFGNGGYNNDERLVKEKIAALPRGYISKKNRNGIIRHYRQWKENGKVKSEYVREEDLDEVTKQIEERKDLEARLKELQKKFPVSKDDHTTFETNVKTGKELAQMVAGVKLLEKRDIYQWIPKYLQSDVKTRVCVIYGLRRTGKTTMLFQAIADMSQEDFAKTAYIKLRTKDIMNNVTRDLDKLWNLGYRYVFIDEVTLMEDFIDTAICKNIQHSLSCFEFGRNFGHLQDLYDAGELTGAINRIIEDMNHRFVVEVLTREFKSADLGLAARNLRNEREPEKRTNILDTVGTSENLVMQRNNM